MTREICREIDMSKIERLRLRYINTSMIAFIKFHSLRPRGGQEKRRRKLFKNGRESSWDATLNQTKMRLHGAFEQQKGSGLAFFFRFWGHSRLWPQNQKKVSPDPFHEHMVRKVYAAKISCSYQLFYGSGPIFFCSVNGAYDWAKNIGGQRLSRCFHDLLIRRSL